MNEAIKKSWTMWLLKFNNEYASEEEESKICIVTVANFNHDLSHDVYPLYW